MARNDPQMNLRVPAELKNKIEIAAFENNRTITAEAVARLERSFALDEKREILSNFHPNHLPAETLETLVTVLENIQDALKKASD